VNPPPSLAQIVEALLFASPEPLTTAALVRTIRSGAALERREAQTGGDTADSDAADSHPDSGEGAGPGAPDEAFELEADPGDPAGSAESSGAAFRRVTEAQVRAALEELIAVYEASGRAFTLQERLSGWRVSTKPGFGVWVRALFPDRKAQRLSQPALETLAIIAYRQPITKAAIEAVRGVTIDGPLQRLLDHNFVRIAGRADLPGRPLLYETTNLFFDHFGIKSIDELPNAAELRSVMLPQPESEQPAPPPAEDAPGGDAGDTRPDPAASEPPAAPAGTT
jgi:segregation and condensation protein B